MAWGVVIVDEFELGVDSNVYDIDELKGVDIKINPDYYIHMALLKAQAALSQDNIREGFIKFRMIVEHVETLCVAANMITDQYKVDIENFKNNVDYVEASDEIKPVKLSNEKLRLMLTKVFKNKTLTTPLKF